MWPGIWGLTLGEWEEHEGGVLEKVRVFGRVIVEGGSHREGGARGSGELGSDVGGKCRILNMVG